MGEIGSVLIKNKFLVINLEILSNSSIFAMT